MRSNTEDQKDKHFVDLPPPTYELALKMMSKESSPEMLPHTAVNLGYNVCWEEMEMINFRVEFRQCILSCLKHYPFAYAQSFNEANFSLSREAETR